MFSLRSQNHEDLDYYVNRLCVRLITVSHFYTHKRKGYSQNDACFAEHIEVPSSIFPITRFR